MAAPATKIADIQKVKPFVGKDLGPWYSTQDGRNIRYSEQDRIESLGPGASNLGLTQQIQILPRPQDNATEVANWQRLVNHERRLYTVR